MAVETSIGVHFGGLPDPQIERCKAHALVAIRTIALCAVLCGAESWVDLETFGREKERWLRTFLGLENGIPSHDTFARVFARLDPAAFERCFLGWVRAVGPPPGGQVAVDGKTVRGSHDRANGKAALGLPDSAIGPSRSFPQPASGHTTLGPMRREERALPLDEPSIGPERLLPCVAVDGPAVAVGGPRPPGVCSSLRGSISKV
jgi:hypothetical protein